MPDAATPRPALPPGPWRIDKTEFASDGCSVLFWRVEDGNGETVALIPVVVDGAPAVAALLVRAREVEEAAREAAEVLDILRVADSVLEDDRQSIRAALSAVRTALGDEG